MLKKVNKSIASHSSKHHRRPRSIGGSSSDHNLAYVRQDQHQWWHVLFGNMNARQISLQLQEYLCMYKNFDVNKYKLVCKFINGKPVRIPGGLRSRKESKRLNAFKQLFKNKTIESILAWINNTWLDPSYHLYLKKIKKIPQN